MGIDNLTIREFPSGEFAGWDIPSLLQFAGEADEDVWLSQLVGLRDGILWNKHGELSRHLTSEEMLKLAIGVEAEFELDPVERPFYFSYVSSPSELIRIVEKLIGRASHFPRNFGRLYVPHLLSFLDSLYCAELKGSRIKVGTFFKSLEEEDQASLIERNFDRLRSRLERRSDPLPLSWISYGRRGRHISDVLLTNWPWPDSAEKLIRDINDPDFIVAFAGALQFARIASRHRGPMAVMLRLLSDSQSSLVIRRLIIRVIGEFGAGIEDGYAEKVVIRLIHFLNDENPEIVREAAKCLPKLGQSAVPAIPALYEKLKSPDPSICNDCARSLGKLAPASIPLVKNLLEDSSDEANKLGLLAADDAGEHGLLLADTLLRFLSHPNRNVAVLCALPIARLGIHDPQLWTRLAETVANYGQVGRVTVAKALALARIPLLDFASHFSAHPEPKMRAAHLRIVSQVGRDHRIREALLFEGLKDPDEEVRYHAADGLEGLKIERGRVEPIMSLLTSSNYRLRLKGARLLKNVSAPTREVENLLQNLAAEDDERVRKEARATLKEWRWKFTTPFDAPIDNPSPETK